MPGVATVRPRCESDGSDLKVDSTQRLKCGHILRYYNCPVCGRRYASTETLRRPQRKSNGGPVSRTACYVALTETQAKLVRALAAKENISQSALLRRAFREHVARIQREAQA